MNAQERERLAKLLAMLTSPHDGEVLNAARAIVRCLALAGLEPAMLQPPAAPPEPVQMKPHRTVWPAPPNPVKGRPARRPEPLRDVTEDDWRDEGSRQWNRRKKWHGKDR